MYEDACIPPGPVANGHSALPRLRLVPPAAIKGSARLVSKTCSTHGKSAGSNFYSKSDAHFKSLEIRVNRKRCIYYD